jgi:hypothetical protein
VDILGKVIHDHGYNDELGNHSMDSLIGRVLENVSQEEGRFDVLKEACDEVKAMHHWRSGRNRI